MTKKESILDCLIDSDEAKTQIVEFFKYINEPITEQEIDSLLEEMINEGLIIINKKWSNEHGEYPFSITQKGKSIWSKINKNN